MHGQASSTAVEMRREPDQSEDNDRKRLVVLVGPHKAACTHVQNFFFSHLAHLPKKGNSLVKGTSLALQEWAFPGRTGKSFASLSLGIATPNQQEAALRAIEMVWNQTNQHVMIATELLDVVGQAEFVCDSKPVLLKILERLGMSDEFQHHTHHPLDIVINFRTPRVDQWISTWKQMTEFENRKTKTYRGWMCRNTSVAYELLHNAKDPFMIVQTYVELLAEHNISGKVHVISMSGVEQRGLDIAHVMACQVLGVSCQDGWVQGISNETHRANVRTADPRITDQEREDIDWLLRQRDCAHAPKMLQLLQGDDPPLQIVNGHDDLWKDCPLALVGLEISPRQREMRDSFRNTTFLMGLLRSQMNCSGAHGPTIQEQRAAHGKLLLRASTSDKPLPLLVEWGELAVPSVVALLSLVLSVALVKWKKCKRRARQHPGPRQEASPRLRPSKYAKAKRSSNP